jgi:hypothetical protein
MPLINFGVFRNRTILRNSTPVLNYRRSVTIDHGSRVFRSILVMIIMVLCVVGQASLEKRDSLLQCIDVPDAG